MYIFDRGLSIGAKYFIQTIGRKKTKNLSTEREISENFIHISIINMIFVHKQAMAYRLILVYTNGRRFCCHTFKTSLE